MSREDREQYNSTLDTNVVEFDSSSSISKCLMATLTMLQSGYVDTSFASDTTDIYRDVCSNLADVSPDVLMQSKAWTALRPRLKEVVVSIMNSKVNGFINSDSIDKARGAYNKSVVNHVAITKAKEYLVKVKPAVYTNMLDDLFVEDNFNLERNVFDRRYLTTKDIDRLTPIQEISSVEYQDETQYAIDVYKWFLIGELIKTTRNHRNMLLSLQADAKTVSEMDKYTDMLYVNCTSIENFRNSLYDFETLLVCNRLRKDCDKTEYLDYTKMFADIRTAFDKTILNDAGINEYTISPRLVKMQEMGIDILSPSKLFGKYIFILESMVMNNLAATIKEMSSSDSPFVEVVYDAIYTDEIGISDYEMDSYFNDSLMFTLTYLDSHKLPDDSMTVLEYLMLRCPKNLSKKIVNSYGSDDNITYKGISYNDVLEEVEND